MPIDPERLLSFAIPEGVVDLTPRDVILYALGIGLGANPLDEKQLRFLYEQRLAALPTFASVLASPGFWLRDPATGVDWVKAVHALQGIQIHRRLPVQGKLTGHTRITGLVDKGPGNAALIHLERLVHDACGNLVCTANSTAFCRGGGGFGGVNAEVRLHNPPDRKPDQVIDLPTLPQAALIYRLSGDLNPLHIDPRVAAVAGFPRPPLHGLCTFGVAGYAVLSAGCEYDSDRLVEMEARFSAPVFPGETIRTEIWIDGDEVLFQSCVPERGVVALANGRARMQREL
jgi:acyl dehydratase